MKKYTIYANCVEELQKVFNRYAKKAEKIGLKPSLTIGEKYPKKCKMYAYDEITHTTKHVDDSVVEVCDGVNGCMLLENCNNCDGIPHYKFPRKQHVAMSINDADIIESAILEKSDKED